MKPLKLHKTIERVSRNVVCKNPNLKDIFKKPSYSLKKP
jgi:hypothetical protein